MIPRTRAGGVLASAVLTLASASPLAGGPAEGLPWEALSNPGQELRRLSEILQQSATTRSKLTELGEFTQNNPDGLARGLAEYAAATLLLKEGHQEEAAALFLSPHVVEIAIAPYALEKAGRALEDRNRGLALRALSQLVAEHPDYVHLEEAQLRLAQLLRSSGRSAEAVEVLQRLLGNNRARLFDEALAELAETLSSLGRGAEAVQALETLYYELPTSRFSSEAGRRLNALAAARPARSAEERHRLAWGRAERLYEAGRYRDALNAYTLLRRDFPQHGDRDRLTLRQGVCQYQLRMGLADKTLAGLGAAAAEIRAEALYTRALLARRARRRDTFRNFMNEAAQATPVSRWTEEALVSLARHHFLENEMDLALGYYGRLATEFLASPYYAEARWRTLWADYRSGRYAEAAAGFEKTARENPSSPEHARFLFWAARAYERAGSPRRTTELHRQVLLGYKNSYYGRQSEGHLARLDGAAAAALTLASGRDGVNLRGAIQVSRQGRLARIGQLLVLGLTEEAALEAERGVAGHEDDAAFQALFAWIHYQRGRYVLAISAMRQAFPFHVAATGDLLPEDVWRILYPLKYWELVERFSRERGLDPYLVAAVIRQESTFNPVVKSRAGARGLMQIMPSTGRLISRQEGTRFRWQALVDPEANIRMGTLYLRQMLDRFGGRVDYALAGYNAGPHRVEKWTGSDLTLDAEEFIEEIPFTETRDYVKAVLRNETQYRRVYPQPVDVASQ
jgi:soluble lytic murein transglycosylase